MLAQLAFQIGEHAARDGRLENAGVRAGEGAFKLGVLGPHDIAEVGGDFEQQADVQTGVVFGSLEDFHQRFGRGMGRPHGHRGDGGVDHFGPGLRGLDQGGHGHAGGRVGVDVNGQIDRFPDGLDQIVGGVGGEQGGHVLDADGVGAHFLQALGESGVAFDGVYRGDGVADGGLGVFAGFLHGLHRYHEVARVIEGIKDAEDVDAVDGHAFDAFFDDVVGIVAVAEDGLAAQEHLVRGVGNGFLEGADAFPGVFVQKADAGVEGGAAPGFDRPEAGGVEFGGHRQHVGGDHAGGVQGLVGVTQDEFGNLDLCHDGFFPWCVS